MRRIFRWVLRVAAVFVVGNLLLVAAVAFPGWAFAHSFETDRLAVHSVSPLPPETAAWVAGVEAALDASPLPPATRKLDIYITGDGWRDRLFFLGAPGVGGLVYAFISNGNVFLSGADIPADRLLKWGETIPPPRTLTFYAVHELTHLIQIQELGTLGYVSMDRWIREGVADFVALGPVNATDAAAIRAYPETADRLPLLQQYGAYPEYRLQVTEAGGDLMRLMGL